MHLFPVILLTKSQAKLRADDDAAASSDATVGPLLVEMGTLYDQRLGKQSRALVHYQRALQVFQQTKDYGQIGSTLCLIGSVHVRKGDGDKALKCYRDSLVMRRLSSGGRGETPEIAETLHSIGNCEARDGRFEDCIESYNSALEMKRKVFGDADHVSIAKTEHCVGLALLQLGQYDEALTSFDSSLKARRSQLGQDHLDVAFSLHRYIFRIGRHRHFQ